CILGPRATRESSARFGVVGRQMDQAGGRGPESTAGVERRQLLGEVDVQPLALRRLSVLRGMADDFGRDAAPLEGRGDLRVAQERVIAAVPRDVDEPDELAGGK